MPGVASLLALLSLPAFVSAQSLRGQSVRKLSEATWMPPRPTDMSCLQPAVLGCFHIRDRTSCLLSKDARLTKEWQGLKAQGEPCVWCGGGPCTNNNSNVCEPYDFLYHGLGIGFHAFMSTQYYEAARCDNGLPLQAWGLNWPFMVQQQMAAAAPTATGAAAAAAGAAGEAAAASKDLAVDVTEAANDALADIPACSAHPGCAALGLSGDCCPPAHGQPLSCCTQGVSANVAPSELQSDRSVRVEGPGNVVQHPPAAPVPMIAANDSWWKTAQPVSAASTSCLMEHRYGCDKVKHHETCLGSRDGRQEESIDGLKIRGQPCVWCGGVPCRSGSTNLCEPLDFLMNGEGKAFNIFFAKATYQAATCMEGKPAPAQAIFRHMPVPALKAPQAPPELKIDDSWWKAAPIPAEDTACLMKHRYGCNVIRHQETCLGSVDSRQIQEIDGLKIRGQPCVWCGGGFCTSKNSTVCEPQDYLMNGEGKAFSIFLAKATYQVASCKGGLPREAESIFRHIPMPPVPTMAPWWIPSSPPTKVVMDCLTPLVDGCFAAKSMGECLTGKDASQVSMEAGVAISGQACIWCGGGPCTSNSSALCAPFDYALRGEGVAFKTFYPKTTYQVASCLTRTVELPPHDFGCLSDAADGCIALEDAGICLSSRDGRAMVQKDGGLKVQGQPCVWCGGLPCTSASSNKCEPFDWVMNGKGQAFKHHALVPHISYRLAGCKNNKPAAMDLKDYSYFVGGYFPPVLSQQPLVPFWVANKPAPEALTCLKPAESGCNSLSTMEACMTSKDGRTMADFMGMKIAGEPCVWCGGIACTTNSTSKCEPFDYVMYGQGKAFGDFTAKGVYKVAGCDKGDIQLPSYDYTCLAASSATGGCTDIWNAEECLASKDSRSVASVGALQLQNQPCVWCGGGACHSGKTAMCEAFDYAVNGEGRAFAAFHAQGTYRLAACKNGKPKAATLENFTDFVPGYSFKPPPLPTLPPREKWWIPPRPSEENISCLTAQAAGCSALTTMGSCLSSRDGRTEAMVAGDLKVQGEPCIWCGGGRCHSNGTTYCEPFDFLMRGEGKAFDTFYTPHHFKVADCQAHIPLPKFDFTCLAPVAKGCPSVKDASTCLMSKDGRADITIDGFKIHDEPCVWCGGTPCTSGGSALCESYDYAMNGEGKAFDYFHGKLTYTFAGCKDNFPAAMTYDGFVPYIQGYFPKYNEPRKILPYWVPERPTTDEVSCLTPATDGCEALTEMKTCLSSSDGRADAEMKGLKINGEPCVWCGGGACASGSKAQCMPFDYAMRGEGRAFTSFNAKLNFRVAGCYTPYKKPDYDYTCLKATASGCSAITNPYDCLGSTDGRSVARIDGLKVQGEPCVWCGGGLCHTGSNNMCEPFDYVMNGAGRAFYNFNAKLTYRMAACQDGHPQGATLEGFQSFIPGAMPTVKPYWWITQSKPQGDELSCLMDHRYGCYVVKHKDTCLGSKDGRQEKEWNGLKIHGEPCVWCGGLPCQSNSTNLCEPYDFLMHGEGKAFYSFNAKTSYNVARCKNGRPMNPDTVEATSRDIDMGMFGGGGSLPGGAPSLPGNPGSLTSPVSHDAAGAVNPDGTPASTAVDDAVKAAGAAATGAAAAAASAAAGVESNLLGKDCWIECGKKGGYCDWCGAGMACCRDGWGENPAECTGAAYTTDQHHECVATATATTAAPSGFAALGLGTLPPLTLPAAVTLAPVTASASAKGLDLPTMAPLPKMPTLAPLKIDLKGAADAATGAASDAAGKAADAASGAADAATGAADAASDAASNAVLATKDAASSAAAASKDAASKAAGAADDAASKTAAAAAAAAAAVGAGVAGAAKAAGDHAKSVTLPSVSMPSVSMPSLSMPSVSMPSVSMPSVSMPSVSLPQGVTMPPIGTLAPLSMPNITMPSLPSLDLTGGDGMPTGNCWDKCGKKPGNCPNYCGAGNACCKKGASADPAECTSVDWSMFASLVPVHTCVHTAAYVSTTGAPIFALRTTPAGLGIVHNDISPGQSKQVVVEPPNYDPSRREFTNATNTTIVLAGAESGTPSWVWVLLGVLLLVCLPLLLFFFLCNGDKKKKKKKSKRAARTNSAESNEDSFATINSELEMQTPLVADRASPSVGESPVQARSPDLFDLIDRNHDGKVTESEFNAAMGAMQVQQQAVTVTTQAVPVTTTTMPVQYQAVPGQMMVVPGQRVDQVGVMQGTMHLGAAPVQTMQPGMPGVVTVSPYGANIQYR